MLERSLVRTETAAKRRERVTEKPSLMMNTPVITITTRITVIHQVPLTCMQITRQVVMTAPVRVPVRVPATALVRVPVKVPATALVRVPVRVPATALVRVPIRVPVRVPVRVPAAAPECGTLEQTCFGGFLVTVTSYSKVK